MALTPPIDLIGQLYEWNSNFEAELRICEQEPMNRFIERAKVCAKDATTLLAEIDHASAVLKTLRGHHDAFVHAANSLRTDAGSLRIEQERLTEEANAVRAALKPFSVLDDVARTLNTAGADASTALKVIGLLDNAETGLTAAERSGVRDIGTYQARLAQLRARGLGLLRTFVCGKLRSVAATAEDPSTAYRAIAAVVRPYIAELEQHCRLRDQAVLGDVHATYAGQRTALLLPIAQAQLAALTDASIETFTREGLQGLTTLCLSESSLASCFFASRTATTSVQEQICGVFYDIVRPKLIRAASMDVVCSIVDAAAQAVTQCEQAGEDATVPVQIAKQLLGDAQERLFFRCDAFIRDRIGAAPPAAALKYPDVLEADAEAGFPPVEDALAIVEIAHNRLESTVFGGIAQEAITLAARQLNDASRAIARSSGALEGLLFSARQLMRLQDATARFTGLASHDTTLDFSSLREALGDVGRLFSMQRWLQVARGPRVTSSRIDAKAELQHSVRVTCESVAAHVTRLLLEPALANDPSTLSNTAEVQAIVDKIQSYIVGETNMLSGIIAKILLYIPAAHAPTLLRPISTSVHHTFSRLRVVPGLNIITDEELRKALDAAGITSELLVTPPVSP